MLPQSEHQKSSGVRFALRAPTLSYPRKSGGIFSFSSSSSSFRQVQTLLKKLRADQFSLRTKIHCLVQHYPRNDSCPEAVATTSRRIFNATAALNELPTGLPRSDPPSTFRALREQPLMRESCTFKSRGAVRARSNVYRARVGRRLNGPTVDVRGRPSPTETRRTTDDGTATNCAYRCLVTSYLGTWSQRMKPSWQVKVALGITFLILRHKY